MSDADNYIGLDADNYIGSDADPEHCPGSGTLKKSELNPDRKKPFRIHKTAYLLDC